MKLLIQMLPIQMMKSPLRSLCQKTPTTKSILTHKIGLDMMKKMLRTRSEINIWLACTKAKMLQKELLQDIILQKRIASRHLLPFVRYALQSKVPMSAITSSMLQYSKCNPILMLNILLLTKDGSLSKKKKGGFSITTFCHIPYALVMILYTLPCLLWHNLLQRQDFRFYNSYPTFWGKKWNLLFIVTIHYHYSPVTIHSKFLPI